MSQPGDHRETSEPSEAPPLPSAVPAPASFEQIDAWKNLAAGAICRGEWPGWPPIDSFSLLREAIHAAGATEGTLWLADESLHALRPVFNTGPHAAMFLEKIRQPLDRGLISMVFATESPFCEESAREHPRHDSTVDSKIGLQTASMAAVPVYFGLRCRGVLSAVTLKFPEADSPPPPLATRSIDLLAAAAAAWGEELDKALHQAATAALAGRPQA